MKRRKKRRKIKKGLPGRRFNSAAEIFQCPQCQWRYRARKKHRCPKCGVGLYREAEKMIDMDGWWWDHNNNKWITAKEKLYGRNK